MNPQQDGEHPCDNQKSACYCKLPANDGHEVHICVCGGSWKSDGEVVTLPDIAYTSPLFGLGFLFNELNEELDGEAET